MTVQNTPRRAGPYISDGVQTEFPFGFLVFAGAEIQVRYAGDEILSPSLYTVTLNADQSAATGGTVNLSIPLLTGTPITLLSVVSESQSTQLTNQGGFYPNIIEGALDRLVVLIQQLSEKVNRALLLKSDDDTDPVALLADLRVWLESAKNLANGETLPQLAALEVQVAALQLTATNESLSRQTADAALAAADTAESAARAAQDIILMNLINALANGATKAYLTYAALDAAKATLPVNSFARVTNDPTPANNWLWQWNGTVLTKSDRDDLAVALAAVTAEEVARIAADALINTTLAQLFSAVRIDGMHDDFGNVFLLALTDALKIGFGITDDLKIFWGENKLELGDVFGIRDGANRYALAVTNTGEVYAPGLVLPAAITAQLAALSQTAVDLATLNTNFLVGSHTHDDAGNVYLFSLINTATGELVFGVTTEGEVVALGEVITGGGAATPRDITPMQLQSLVKTQVMHVVGDSQSLGLGTATVSAISTTQPYNNIMFTSGVTKAIGDGSYSATAFVPLIESNGVESPTAGALNGFVRRVVAAGGVASEYVMLGTQAGVGGQRIAALTDEALYVRLRQHITDAKAVAVANGQTYSVAAITWIQGEADISGSLWTRAIDYYQRYLALMTKIRDTALNISNQDYLPTVFSYQTSAHMYYNKRYLGIAIAQWRASVERKDICLATPAYRLPHAADNLHLTNEGSWLLGEYIARAMYWTLIKGQKWRPLEPIDVTWTATHIDVRYHVPCKPIQLSTVICNAATNQGFDIWTNGSVYDSGATSNDDTLISNAISSVAVVADDTIRITFTGGVTIPTDAVLSYGRGRAGDSQTAGPITGARGNVVDSHGIYDKATAPTGTVFDLSNVSVHFEHGCKDGFF